MGEDEKALELVEMIERIAGISLDCQTKAKIQVVIINYFAHYTWDHTRLRLEYPSELLNKMPTKKIGNEEAISIKKKWTFNPVYFYDKKISLQLDELGHDEAYRYILRRPSDIKLHEFACFVIQYAVEQMKSLNEDPCLETILYTIRKKKKKGNGWRVK